MSTLPPFINEQPDPGAPTDPIASPGFTMMGTSDNVCVEGVCALPQPSEGTRTSEAGLG